MKTKNILWLKRLATALILGVFLFGIVPFSILPAPAEASHSLKFDIDRPDGGYLAGKDLVTFTIKNTGNDVAYIGCGGIKVYSNAQGGQQQQVVGEMNSCYVFGGAMTVSYEIQSGDTHLWQWNQKDSGVNQVPDGRYTGKIVVDENTNKQTTWQTHNFWIDSDVDGDGIIGPDDKCPNVKPQKDNNPKDGCEDDSDFDGVDDVSDKCPSTPGINEDICTGDSLGCPDWDRDGVPDQKDDGSNPDKCRVPGGPLFPTEPVAEDCNDYKDHDGCPDEKERVASKMLAATTAIGLTVAGHVSTEAGLVIIGTPVVGPFLALVAFVMEATAEINAHRYWEIAYDPPDTVNYKEVYEPELPSPATNNIISSGQPDMQMLMYNSLESASLAKAYRISRERHNGALIVGDYAAALKQAKAAREYATQASEVLNVLADGLEIFAADSNVRNINLERLKQVARDFRQKVLSEGADALPETEREILKNEGEESLLPNLLALVTNESRIDNMKHPSEQFVETAGQLRDMAEAFDYDSKTYGSNIYLTASETDVKTSVGVYYENAPNDVNKFVIELAKPANAKFVRLAKGDSIAGWITFTLRSAKKIKVIGFRLWVFGSTIKAGHSGRLLDLEFEPQTIVDAGQYNILNLRGDMKNWQGAQNMPPASVRINGAQV